MPAITNDTITAGPASGTAADRTKKMPGADRGADAEHGELEGPDRARQVLSVLPRGVLPAVRPDRLPPQ